MRRAGPVDRRLRRRARVARRCARARDKLARKGLDAIVVNDISRPDIGFDSDQNEVMIIGRDGELHVPRSSKEEVATRVLDFVQDLRAARDRSSSAGPGPVSEHEAYDLFQRGLALIEESHWAQAAVPLEKAKRLEPDKSSIREALGRAYFRSGRYREAADEFSAVRGAPAGERLRALLPRALAGEARRPAPPPAGTSRWRCGMRPDRTDYRLYRDRLRAAVRALIQRVSSASVTVERETVGEIGAGLVVLLGVGRGDDAAQAAKLADKVARLRVFDDEERAHGPLAARRRGRARCASASSRSTATCAGDCGRASPRLPTRRTASGSTSSSAAIWRGLGCPCRTGRFGARMSVGLVNEGPVTLLLEA